MDNMKFEKFNIGELPFYHYAEVSSTNLIAKELVTGGTSGSLSSCVSCTSCVMTCDTVPHGTVVIADSQTEGRGRLGRSFESPEGSGLYMSIVLRPDQALFNPMLVTAAAGVSVIQALKKVCSIDADIKWVNDILFGGKKLCGILAEGMMNTCSGSLDAIILGIGINLKNPSGGYTDEIAEIVTNIESMLASSGNKDASGDGSCDYVLLRDKLASEIRNNVLLLLSAETSDDEIVSLYKSLCSTIGQDIFVYKHGLAGEGVPAKAVDIDKDCGLVVQYKNDAGDGFENIETLTFGEISIRRK